MISAEPALSESGKAEAEPFKANWGPLNTQQELVRLSWAQDGGSTHCTGEACRSANFQKNLRFDFLPLSLESCPLMSASGVRS